MNPNYPNKSINIKTYTHDGRQITPLENVFIQEYMKTKNAALSVKNAGYRAKNPAQQVK